MNLRHLAVRGAPAVVLLVIASACTLSGDRVRVAVPAPDEESSRMCGALHDALPDAVAGLERRETDPSSPFTSAWGDPAVVLRCGVTRPDELNDPEAVGAELRGVGWTMVGPHEGSYRCTTTLRKAYVEVRIPAQHGDVEALLDLASAIKATVPEGI